MPTTCLRLLLLLSLLLNAVAAPWAMAHRHDGMHVGAAASWEDGEHPRGHAMHGAEAEAESALQADHEQHSGHEFAATGASDGDAEAHVSDCCDGSACRCGCLLPMAMPLFPLKLAAMPPPPGRALPSALALLPMPTVPPFRPPSA